MTFILISLEPYKLLAREGHNKSLLNNGVRRVGKISEAEEKKIILYFNNTNTLFLKINIGSAAQ